MPNYWCVNFESVGGLHHGIRNKLWLMGYQYAKKGGDTPGRKSAITRNWNRLAQIAVGDRLLDDWQNKGRSVAIWEIVPVSGWRFGSEGRKNSSQLAEPKPYD